MRYRCENHRCNWIGEESEILRAQHPFDPDDKVYGCPKCLDINTLMQVCDEPGCDEFGGCGTPTPNGYRWTCGKHRPV